jgi:hypothetical protein
MIDHGARWRETYSPPTSHLESPRDLGAEDFANVALLARHTKYMLICIDL